MSGKLHFSVGFGSEFGAKLLFYQQTTNIERSLKSE